MQSSIPRVSVVLASMLLACAAASCDGARAQAEEPKPTSSPEAVVAHLRAADASREWGAMLDVIAPAERGIFVWAAWFGAAYAAIAADEETVAAYEAICSEHGLDRTWLDETSGESIGREKLAQLADKAFADVDRAALLTDLLAFTTGERSFFGTGESDGKIAVEDERAVATLGGTELVLRRVDGAWYWFRGGDEDE